MRRDHLIYAVALALSVTAHLGTFVGLGHASRTAPKERRVLELAVIEKPRPPPPAEPPEPKPPPPEPPKPKPVDLTKLARLPPPESPPPPNTTETPPPAAEPVRPVFGVTMRSTVGQKGGTSFSVRVGNTLMKEPERELTPPAEVKPYAPVPLHEVTKMPHKLAECDVPEESRKLGIEGKVRLEIEVLATGAVGEVLVVVGLRPDVDAMVVAALKRCAFAPGEIGGQAVTTRIPYTYSFYVED